MKKIRTIEELPIDSTRLCCNFVNTVYSWKGDDRYDFFVSYDKFINWCIKLSVYEKSYLDKLRKKAKQEPAKAHSALRKITGLRDLMHDFISAIATNARHKTRSLLPEVNIAIADALVHTKIEYSEGVLISSYKNESMNFMSPVWVIIKSLYDMLTHDDHVRIKECSSCGWVFYDETKNGKRRWCNPLNCGTKDKMDRYTQSLKDRARVIEKNSE